jgi:hypothetical protein
MQKLLIEGTKITPLISGDPETGNIEISGRSIPENATGFYKPLMDWICAYKLQANSKTQLSFHLDYLNSISQKIVYDILEQMIEINEKSELVILWKYDEDDEEILDEGKVFKSRFELDFRLVEVPDN